MVETTIDIPAETDLKLNLLAAQMNRGKGWVINQAIKAYVDRHNLVQSHWQETQDALDAVAHGRILAGERVHRWLRSWGTADELAPPAVDS